MKPSLPSVTKKDENVIPAKAGIQKAKTPLIDSFRGKTCPELDSGTG